MSLLLFGLNVTLMQIMLHVIHEYRKNYMPDLREKVVKSKMTCHELTEISHVRELSQNKITCLC